MMITMQRSILRRISTEVAGESEDRLDSVVMFVGTVCPGCFSFVEILGKREKFGYLIDICTRVPFGELVGQNIEIFF